MSKAKRFVLRNSGIRQRAVEFIRDLPADQVWDIQIKKYVKHRSDRQHGYLRVLEDIVSEHTGYTTDELHNMFRTKAGLWTTVHGVQVLKSTKDMNTQEMSDLIETVLRVSAQDLDLQLPPPEQVWAA
jgi:hypothetical protein